MVTFSDGSTITYTYGADGTKLKTVHKIGNTATTTDYCGNVVYENGFQKLLLAEEGYVTLSDSKYHYYLKDHQGNHRMVSNSSGNVEKRAIIILLAESLQVQAMCSLTNTTVRSTMVRRG